MKVGRYASRLERFSRRGFLGGTGAALMMGLPCLDVFTSRTALAQAAPKKRLFALYCGNGMLMTQKEEPTLYWTPLTTGPDFALTPLLNHFAPIRKKITVLSGIGLSEGKASPGDHGCGTGTAFNATRPKPTAAADYSVGPSFDQLVAQKVKTETRIASLQIGLSDGGNLGDGPYGAVYLKNVSWASATQPLSPTIQPQALFDQIFAGYDPTASAAENLARLQRRISVLDYVTGERSLLLPALGSSDQQRVDQYFTSVREVEQRLQTIAMQGGGPGCGSGLARPGTTALAYPDLFKTMADLAVLSLQCDLTRVVTFHMGCYRNDNHYAFLGATKNHHTLSHYRGASHDPAEKGQYLKICDWLVQQMAYIFTKMDGIQEPTGTLLDNSIGFYTSDCGDSNVHDHNNLPVLVAGSAGGALVPGSHFQFPSDTPAAKLYITLMNALGVDVKTFGARGDGPLTLA